MFLFVGEGVFFAGNAMINSGLRTLLELYNDSPTQILRQLLELVSTKNIPHIYAHKV